MHGLLKIWEWLTEPVASAEDDVSRRRSRLLASLLLAVVPLSLMLSALPALMGNKSILEDADFVAAASSVLFWLIAYILCRFGRYQVAAGLAVYTASTAIFAAVRGDDDFSTLGFLILPLLAASIFLSFRATIVLLVFDLLGIVMLTALSLTGRVAANAEVLVAPMSLLLIGAAPILWFSRHRDQLELERQAHLKEREARYRSLFEASTAISSDLSLEVVLGRVAENMARALDSSGCALSRWDREQDAVITLVNYGLERSHATEAPGKTYLLEGHPATRHVLETCRPLVVQRDDPAADSAEKDLMARYGAHSLLMVPLVAHDKVLGLAELIDVVKQQEYTPSQIHLAQSLAGHAAVAIENARLYEESQRRIQELAGLYDTAIAIAGALETDRLLRQLYEQVQRLMNPDTFVAVLYDEQDNELQVAFAEEQGQTVPGVVGVPVPLEQGGLTAWVMRERQSLLVRDLEYESLPAEPRHGARPARAWLGVPLLARGQLVGAISVQSFRANAFGEADQRFLEAIAAQIGIGIENARLVEALRQHATELEERNEELDAYAHTVAHDLKSPLAYVIGFCDVLETYYGALPEEELKNHLRTLARHGRKLTNIVDELLLLAGVRQVKKVNLMPLDMARIVADTQLRLSDLIEENDARIAAPESWPQALGHHPWVEQVWVNYISNAIKYGGSPPDVEVGAQAQADGTIRFWVRDNGAGLSSEEQERLFTPFTRLDQFRAKGHGLGLSIVRRIVERLGGRVAVESQVGQGCVFSFTLPSASDEGDANPH